ncbi:hypothetical protein [Candidatus Sororendozoicomonas aggregata]|uniref:hypothetical protein n=1 Tax=Candidatus Sororendozoicomonas aggregata TaxID=3073239 RepID=UPI002ED2E450
MTLGKACRQMIGAVYFSSTASNIRVRFEQLKKTKIQLPRCFDSSNRQKHLWQRKMEGQPPHPCYMPKTHKPAPYNSRW